MTFRVGQRVVCVNAQSGFAASYVVCPLKENDIYKITAIRDDATRTHGAGIMVDGDPLHFWSQKRFRPAVERKTSIEIFTAMLKPSKVNADA